MKAEVPQVAGVVENTLINAEILSMLGSGFAVSTAAPALVTAQLFAPEQQHVARAVARRQAEFGTARVCARRALAQFGVAPMSLEPHPDRSPRWPAGFKGSITHTSEICAATVTPSADIRGIGLDIEGATPLQAELESMICLPAEQAWLAGFDAARRALLGKLFFCAKEAFYKCQYETTRSMLDFSEVEIAIDLDAGTFGLRSIAKTGDLWAPLAGVRGVFREAGGLIIATAVLASSV